MTRMHVVRNVAMAPAADNVNLVVGQQLHDMIQLQKMWFTVCQLNCMQQTYMGACILDCICKLLC